jgi:hypothetical protein
MNWIQIDQILNRMIERHDSAEDIYSEAEKQFKWDRKQARDAVDPLLKRNTKQIVVAEQPKTRSKKLRNK